MTKRQLLMLILTISINIYSQGFIKELSYTEGIKNTDFRSHLDKDLIYITFDVKKIYDNDALYLEFEDGDVITYVKNYVELRSEDDFYTSYTSSEGDFSISVVGDNVLGTISHKSVSYQLENYRDNIYTLRQYTTTIDDQDLTDYIEDEGQEGIETAMAYSSDENTLIRVLVLFPQHLGFSSNTMRNIVNLNIGYANESFVNSQINATLQVVYIGTTDYIGNNIGADELRHFKNSSDSYLNEVHTLRNKYSADICILMDNITDVCGIAHTIPATSSSAFAVVKISGKCRTKFTLAHEIGHLMGCRHNREEDANIIPYAYCHGLFHLDGEHGWRTMMAYDTNCSDTNPCNRIKYWSNPNILYNGVSTGNASWCNNARVWNNRKSTVSQFREEPNSATLTNEDVANAAYAWLIANDEISTSGTVNIGTGTIANLQANTIRLSAGFRAQAGSTVYIGSNNHASIPRYGHQSGTTFNDFEIDTDELHDSPDGTAIKFFRDGHIYISQNGHIYSAAGLLIE